MDSPQLARDGRNAFEEIHCLSDSHIQDIGNRFSLVLDLKSLAVITTAMADFARHVDIRQKVHFDFDNAVAAARFASTAFNIEREATGLVAAHTGVGSLAEKLADHVEDTGVRRRVGAGCPANRALIDVDDLVDQLRAVQRIVGLPRGVRSVADFLQARVKSLLNQRRLSRAGDPGDTDEKAERYFDIDIFQVVTSSTLNLKKSVGRRTPFGGYFDRLATGQVLSGDAFRTRKNSLQRSFRDDAPTVLAGAGAHVDIPIGSRHHLFVMLDHQDRVAQISQAHQCLDESGVVALVQPDTGLVQYVENSHQP